MPRTVLYIIVIVLSRGVCFSIDKSKALSLLVHCADISHPAKDWSLHSRWTDQLVEEFFKQVRYISTEICSDGVCQ